MRVVELRRRRPEDASVETLARIYARDAHGPAVIDAINPEDLGWIRSLLDQGGVVDGVGHALDPQDGERYVEALTWSFRGSRLWAEEVPADEVEG